MTLLSVTRRALGTRRISSEDDREPLEVLLHRTGPRLQAILGRYRIPYEDAEDLLQDALLQFVRNAENLRNPEAYLRITLQYRCLMYWRHCSQRRQEAVATERLEEIAEPQEPAQESAALRRDLRRLLASLSPRIRHLIRLRYGLGYTAREIAEKTGAPQDAVRQRSTYARTIFARQMARFDLL